MLETFLVCRTAREPLGPNHTRGRFCKVCKDEVQVSPTGQAQLRTLPNIVILCNPCGLKLTHHHYDQGTLEAVGINPAAAEQFARMMKRGDS